MNMWDNLLVNPPIASSPSKTRINLATLGLVVAILAGARALVATLGLFGLSAVCNLNAIEVCGFPVLSLVGEFTIVAAMLLCVLGGMRLYRLNARGRVLVVYGLVLGIIGTVMFSLGYPTVPVVSGGLSSSLALPVVLFAVAYYFLMVARFPERPTR
jgi:hypothetical protein